MRLARLLTQAGTVYVDTEAVVVIGAPLQKPNQPRCRMVKTLGGGSVFIADTIENMTVLVGPAEAEASEALTPSGKAAKKPGRKRREHVID